jgi:hypothetical protein
MQIEFIASDASVVEYFAPQPARKAVPTWYKDLALTRDIPEEALKNYNTIKNCMPVQDLITSGYIIFNTYEFVLEPLNRLGYEESMVTVRDAKYLDQHHHQQCPVALHGQRKHYIKINQPWRIRTPPGYSCLIQQPFYHFQTGWRVLPAIVDTDLHDQPVSIPMYTLGSEAVTVASGEPLIQIIPFRREAWSMTVTQQQPMQSRLLYSLKHMYRTLFHAKKLYD